MSDKKKLMLFSHVSNIRNITGAEKLLLFLARTFSSYFDCTIVAPHEGRLTQLATDAGIRTIIREFPLLYGMFTPYEGLPRDVEAYALSPECKEAIALLEAERPDYVFVNTCVNVIPAVAAKSLAIPVIWHITEVIFADAYLQHAIHTIDRYSDLIICISTSAMSPFRSYLAESKLALFYPSWNHEEFRPAEWQSFRQQKRKKWGVPEHAKLIGYISSFLTPEKGADHFIKAATIIGAGHPEARFVIIGGEINKGFARKLRRLVTYSAMKQRFIFVDHELNIEAAYCAMDIVVIPGLVREGFGLTALEALIFGKPVVAYASGGLEEILMAVGSGRYLVPTGNMGELAAKVRELLDNPGVAEQVGRDNHHGAMARFGAGAYGERVQQIVRQIQGLTGKLVHLPMPPAPFATPPRDIPAAMAQDEASASQSPVKSSRHRRRHRSGRRKRVKGRGLLLLRRKTVKRSSLRGKRRRSSRRRKGR
ncbi:glycosyltransferase family 4 protein [Paenibacillus aceti]|nr:glycosyltransferase family 4 protein [Paenibacillus aceti]